MHRWCAQSQVSLSQLPSVSRESSNLLQELAAFLRRALSQQAVVKQALYHGLLAVAQADPSSVATATALLLPHLQTYIRPNVCATLARKQELNVGYSASFLTVNRFGNPKKYSFSLSI